MLALIDLKCNLSETDISEIIMYVNKADKLSIGKWSRTKNRVEAKTPIILPSFFEKAPKMMPLQSNSSLIDAIAKLLILKNIVIKTPNCSTIWNCIWI